MNEEMIAPCPFCGGAAERFTITDADPINVGGDVIACCRCGASSHVEFGRKENLVSIWNTRTPAEPRLADSEMVEKVARALCKSHKLNPNAKIACLNPEHHHKPQWVTFKAHAQAAIAAYNPNERLREALETIAFLTADGTEWADWKHLGDVARTALSPLPQGEE